VPSFLLPIPDLAAASDPRETLNRHLLLLPPATPASPADSECGLLSDDDDYDYEDDEAALSIDAALPPGAALGARSTPPWATSSKAALLGCAARRRRPGGSGAHGGGGSGGRKDRAWSEGVVHRGAANTTNAPQRPQRPHGALAAELRWEAGVLAREVAHLRAENAQLRASLADIGARAEAAALACAVEA
jgi:hypothetical protein